MKATAKAVSKELKRAGTPEKAKGFAWFFKTKEGEYGFGDVFYGVMVPQQRAIAKQFHDLPLPEIAQLLQNKVHECRLTALMILVGQYVRADEKGKARIVKFYLANRARVNNWDLVDLSAPYILGDYLRTHDRTILYKLAKSQVLWDRRIAIVATAMLIRHDEYEDTLRVSEILLGDKHDLIHKAVGWMLREVGKRSLAAEEKFLKRHKAKMPRTALRYAIERFPEPIRKEYLKK